MGVYFWGTQILFDNDMVAMHEDCCCCYECSYCLVPADTPCYFNVTFTGIVNQDCSDCDDFNKKFRLKQKGTGADACFWCYYFDEGEEICDATEICLRVIWDGRDADLLVKIELPGGDYLRWRNVESSKIDCANLSPEWLGSPTDTSEECSLSSSTCKVESV